LNVLQESSTFLNTPSDIVGSVIGERFREFSQRLVHKNKRDKDDESVDFSEHT